MELIRKLQQLQEERVHTYKIFEEGHKIYLSSGPSYDFIQFRSLVNDVTQDFKRISEEVIQIECALRNERNLPKLANLVAAVQDSERVQLQLMAQLQLARQELQEHFHEEDAAAVLKRNVSDLQKGLQDVREHISEHLQELIYLAEDFE